MPEIRPFGKTPESHPKCGVRASLRGTMSWTSVCVTTSCVPCDVANLLGLDINVDNRRANILRGKSCNTDIWANPNLDLIPSKILSLRVLGLEHISISCAQPPN